MRSLRKATQAAVICMAVLPVLHACASCQSDNPSSPKAGETKLLIRTEDIPACDGTASPTIPTSHSITLSWNASVPESTAARDAVKGYYVYRSVVSETFSESNRMNTNPMPGTRCVDRDVAPKGTYHYKVKALAENGARSGYSQQVTAIIP